jgi:dienelactone hydrolase
MGVAIRGSASGRAIAEQQSWANRTWEDAMKKSRRRVSVLCAALVAVVAAGHARAEIKTEWIDYKLGDTPLRGYLAYDDASKAKRPGVLLVHRRDGMSALTLKNAEMVARLGYVVFAPDIFGGGIVPKDVPEMIAQTVVYNKDRPLMRARAMAGFDVLRQNPMVDTAKLAVLGYCFGGTVAVELAEAGAPIVGTVTIHGSFRNFTPGAAKNIKGRVLILHGAEDPVAPLSEVDILVKDLRAAKTPWQLELYSGTEHGFSTPKNADEERANTQSQGAMARFFKEVFGT